MEKFATGIKGFDELTHGGLPHSRITLIAGGAGCGKTLFMLMTMARGVADQGEPVVFLSFEERPEDIIDNAASIGLDLQSLIDSKRLHIEFVNRPTEAVAEVGSYNLDGLLVRIEVALKRLNARYLAIDTIETLFSMFEDQRIVRQELVRMFAWLKERGITTVLSGEQGVGQLTRHGLEEYVSDCVILLDQRTVGDVATRRLRIVKYRGAKHGTNEYPFLINSEGIIVMPLSSAPLDHPVSTAQVSTGIERLDTALVGGLRKGSTTLISGTTGTGKTLFAASIINAACRRGERALVTSFEESPDELLLHTASVGLELEQACASGHLTIHSARPMLLGLEQHLVEIYRLVEKVQPDLVMVDPLSSLMAAGTPSEVHRTCIRLIDHLKRKRITTVLAMEERGESPDDYEHGVSSIIDSWLFLERHQSAESLQRRLSVIKKRGSAHEQGHLWYRIGSDGITFERTGDG